MRILARKTPLLIHLDVGKEAIHNAIGAFVRNVETQIAELEKIKPGSRTAPAAAAGETAPVDLPDRRPPTGTPVQDPAEELTDLREVLRLGRHLLEGRQVTL